MSNWFFHDGTEVRGPFTADVLHRYIQNGDIGPDTFVCAEGSETWAPLRELQFDTGATPTERGVPAGQGGVMEKLAGKVGQVAGLRRLEGFSLACFLSQVFKRRTPEDIEEHFAVGTSKTTPPVTKVDAAWPTPWAFVRLLGLSIAASFGIYFLDYPMLRPAWIFAGCVGVPFAVLVLFMEINVLRNVSFYRVVILMLMGALSSLFASRFLYDFLTTHTALELIAYSIVVEALQLFTVVWFTRKWLAYKWMLNGLLFGAAVGAGFSAFKSMGRVYCALVVGKPLLAEMEMIIHGILSPFTDTIWTAAVAAALWRVKAGVNFTWGMLLDWRFLRVFALVVALQAAWYSPTMLVMVGNITLYIVYLITLGLVGWMIVLLLVQSGLQQVREAQKNT